MKIDMDIEKIKKGEIKDLTGANLTWADLTGANLTRANYGNEKYSFVIKKAPVQIMLKHSILIFAEEGYIQAGCHLKTIKEWEEITKFDDQEFLDEWKDKILAFAK